MAITFCQDRELLLQITANVCSHSSFAELYHCFPTSVRSVTVLFIKLCLQKITTFKRSQRTIPFPSVCRFAGKTDIVSLYTRHPSCIIIIVLPILIDTLSMFKRDHRYPNLHWSSPAWDIITYIINIAIVFLYLLPNWLYRNKDFIRFFQLIFLLTII